jgi:hypothetical protein
MPAHLMRYFFAYRFDGTGNLYRLHDGGLVQAAFGRAVSLLSGSEILCQSTAQSHRRWSS